MDIGTDGRTLLTADAHGRITLGSLARGHTQFVATVDEFGRILLTAFVMTETEAKLLANPELSAQICEAMEHPERRISRGRPRRHV